LLRIVQEQNTMQNASPPGVHKNMIGSL